MKHTVWVPVCLSFLGVGCLEQYDPSKHWNKYNEEQALANRPIMTLADNGTIPVVAPAASAANSAPKTPVEEKYDTLCATCHGLDGKAQTPAGQALVPHPRNFTDKAWQDKVSDEHIAEVITKGGAAVGLSPSMAPWGPMLPGDLVKEMVAKVRSFKSKE